MRRHSPDRPIRVLVQLNSLELGGTQINAVDLAAALHPLGFESVLVGPADSRPAGPSLFDVAVERDVPLIAIARPRTTLSGARALNRVARQFDVDLVHTYSTWTIRPAFWGPSLLGRRPLVLTVYEMSVADSVHSAPHLIVGTGYLVDDLLTRHGPVSLISPPVDTVLDDTKQVDVREFLRGRGLNPGNLRVVIVSRLDGEPLRPVKTTAIEAAIGAMVRMMRSNVDLVIVGGGRDEARLRSLAEAANGELGREAVHLTGWMSDPRPAYASADVVIGMGGSAARALSFGKPLIVSGEYGRFDTFRATTSLDLFRKSFWSEERRSDPTSALMAELEPLLADEGDRAELGFMARDFALSHFGLTAMSHRLAEVYRRSLAEYGFGDWLWDLDGELRAVARRLPNRLRVRG